MARAVYLLDLRDADLAQEYADWHRPGRVPSAVLSDIRATGIIGMEIFHSGNRLAMVVETRGNMNPGRLRAGPETRAWEECMDAYQQPLSWAPETVKWQLTNRIFNLSDHEI
ncbi:MULTISPECIES: L-rhamnose mutarotase [Sphingopyxis]|uniref:L-rhamnose mutarotase n=1 Tax=Sphingopyxis TaxID=165697 RepID=UPI000CDF4ED3|nr:MULTISPECIES: L-rhamnose mutarotase [Sphingopyxis]AVA14916.1 L-rhamnose mutarotase [Sphingopyxis sp. MG]QUM73195.1 L-rhamnose mutarotase [Sphingopyxis granuli]